eukprot:TRINITY_DN12333_c0_g1_i1.p1 TRINITY_DN12333_c0_g1~~TRINITY_DN12333_c0_g1_i1.p1  ORF type:complete len:599 (-),score=97.41 TRINITY_DN12333_c0_g1_i1:141-1937(-)
MSADNEGAPREVAHFISGPWPVVMAWFCFMLVFCSTLSNAYRHLLSYSRPDLQTHVLRIIMVSPIYAFSGALCLSMEAGACFFVASVRDIWEAVVIYSFLTLIVEYMGGEHLCLHSISQREEGVPHLFPLNFCFRPIPVANMIRLPKMGALQFVVVKPVVTIFSIVAYACDVFDRPYYQWTIFIVYNISYSTALYALYLVYWASHEHQALQSKKPLLKFLSVKMIVFLTFWQAFLLPHVPLPGPVPRWEDLIISIEMVVFALLMNTAFSWREFHSGLRDTSGLPKGLCLEGESGNADNKTVGGDHIDLIDLGDVPPSAAGGSCVMATGNTPASAEGDACSTTAGATSVGKPCQSSGFGASTFGSARAVVVNAGSAFSPGDVIADASHTFSRRYQKHVLIESAQEYELGVHSGAAPGYADNIDLLGDFDHDGGDHAARSSSPKGVSGLPSPGVGDTGASAAGVGLGLRTFRARTYLIGRSLSTWGGGGGAAGGSATAAVGDAISPPGEEAHQCQGGDEGTTEAGSAGVGADDTAASAGCADTGGEATDEAAASSASSKSAAEVRFDGAKASAGGGNDATSAVVVSSSKDAATTADAASI